MATNKNGFMGAFNGRLGTAVAYTWKGRQCLRTYNAHPKNPRTRDQQVSRAVFGTASRLAADMADATGIGLRGIAAERNTSVHNVFVSLNRQCAVVEEYGVCVDYASLKVSDGGLAGVAFGALHVGDDHEIGVNYDDSLGSGCCFDYVYLYAYVPSMGYGRLSMPSARSKGHVALVMPDYFRGREAHFYGFVWDHDAMASPSSYIGRTVL